MRRGRIGIVEWDGANPGVPGRIAGIRLRSGGFHSIGRPPWLGFCASDPRPANVLMNQRNMNQTALKSPAASTSMGAPRVRIAWDEWLALALLACAVAPTIPELVAEWILRPEYSHGFLMPLVCAWVVWERRDRLAALPRRDTIAGWIVVAFSMLLLLLGEMKLSFFLKPVAMVTALGGLVLAFRGWQGLKAFVPALIPLCLMCPLPGRVERSLTLPLKNIAALFATGMLDICGVPATLEGNSIHVAGIDSLFVAEACSGIRSLISLGSIAVLAAVFWPRPLWERLAVVAAAPPIAIAINSLRIWLTGMISVHMSPQLAQGVFHFLEGFVLFAVAAVILLAFAMLLDKCRAAGEA